MTYTIATATDRIGSFDFTVEQLGAVIAAATPGPWLTDETHAFNIYSDDATGSIIATTTGFQYAPRPEEEKRANTNLMAASKDLAVALRASLAREAKLREALDAAVEKMGGTIDGPMTPFQRVVAADVLENEPDANDVYEMLEQMQEVFAGFIAALGDAS